MSYAAQTQIASLGRVSMDFVQEATLLLLVIPHSSVRVAISAHKQHSSVLLNCQLALAAL